MANAVSIARTPVEKAQEGWPGRTRQRAHRRGLVKIVIGITATVAWLPLVGFGCAVNQEFVGSGQPKIQFEGDSITLLATDDINAWFGPGHDVAIDAYWGATTYEDQAMVADDAALHPDVAVINLGTNDARTIVTGRSYTDSQGATVVVDPVEPLANVEARLQAMVDAFAPACVVLVTINDQDPDFYRDPAELDNAIELNTWIRSVAGAQVADWAANLQTSYFDTNEQGISKAPHPNEAGRQALLALEEQAISRCSAAVTTTTT